MVAHRDGGSTPTSLGLPPPISCQCPSVAKPSHLDAWETRSHCLGTWTEQSRTRKGPEREQPRMAQRVRTGAFKPQSMQSGALEMPARFPPCPRPRAHLTPLDNGIGLLPSSGPS